MVSSLFYHKQGYHVVRAETPPRERDCASDLGIAKMHQRQKFGVRPSLSLIGLDHDMSLMCVCYWSTGRLRVADTFLYFLERLVAQVRPQIFFSRTLEKLSRTLEPCISMQTECKCTFYLDLFSNKFFSHQVLCHGLLPILSFLLLCYYKDRRLQLICYQWERFVIHKSWKQALHHFPKSLWHYL